MVSLPFILSRLTQQFLEICERGVGRRWFFLGAWILSRQPFGIQVAGVLVVVAVDAQQFPVAAVGRIVPVIMVFVMDRQLPQFFAGEIPAAFCADPREDLQGPLSVLNFFHAIFILKGKIIRQLLEGNTKLLIREKQERIVALMR